MLSCKRANSWRFKAITLAIIGSIGWLLFYTLRLELHDGTAVYSSKKKYGYNIFRATSLRFDNPVGEFSQFTQFKDFVERNFIARTDRVSIKTHKKQKNACTKLDDCFNFDRCNSGFYIYIYPLAENQFLSVMYGQILEAIKSSIYITDDPRKACVFILSLDTLDRDKLSKNFVKDLHRKISQLDYWNNGENHLILNMFSGTWPDYLDELSFNYGKAIIAKASFSYNALRPNYDISIPLLPKDFPLRNEGKKNLDLFPNRRKYLLAFKGKRYLHGIGSETRNSLYVIDNNNDIVLLTSCRHGKNWEKMKDGRCDEDNKKYESYDYVDLLSNATFCLVPRGRRLGSFRLLEAIEHGCIPVILSNGWALPFSEVIDWAKFAITIDERLLLQIPSIVRSISDDEILARRQQTLFMWDKYFSSIEKVMFSMIELLRERILPNLKRHHLMWNSPPGALKVDPQFSTSPLHYPFYGNLINRKPVKKFTAIILAVSPVYRSSSPLFQLIKSINLSQFIDQILVVWLPSVSIPDKTKWPRTKVTLRVIHPPKKDMNARYVHTGLVKTDAIYSFDEDVVINTSEIDFAFSVWCSNPTRLVGFSTGSHYMNEDTQPFRWNYTASMANEYSVIRVSSAIFHRYYSYYYTLIPPAGLHELVKREKNCESLAMNFVISSISGKPPIKVARSGQFKDGALTKPRLDVSFTRSAHEATEQRCFQELIRIFKELPLTCSKLSFNPILYKDPVSISRKKYKTLG